jgi:hypothetical protein
MRLLEEGHHVAAQGGDLGRLGRRVGRDAGQRPVFSFASL